ETELRPRIPEPTRAELMARFEENQEEWRKPARRKMSLIEVRIRDRLSTDTSSPTPELLEEARHTARERIDLALRDLQNGVPFDEVARRYSDGSAASEGGAWGWIGRDSVRPRYQTAVDSLYELKSNQVSGIVSADDGFFIVRCDEYDPGMEPDFQAVQPQLLEKHFRQNYNRMLAEVVQDLRGKARIEPENLELFHSAVVTAGVNVHAEVSDVEPSSVNLVSD
ncbi:MAG: peptidylprolyl isomerase, partial [Planctomycetota bacterium]